MATFRPPKPIKLTEKETITSFTSWKENLTYNLSINNDFAPFLEATFTWQKPTVTNRGLQNDGNDVQQDRRKTAAQKRIQLDHMIGYIASFAPSLLYNDLVNRSTSLETIWKRIRKHYSFNRSEANFLKLINIKRESEERYETLFQRIVAHLQDNLLTTDSDIKHDGETVTENEEMTPTCERLAVFLWLTLIDQRLPSYVMRVYSHDLQKMSLKDLQPQMCDAMDQLLAEINNQEDIQVQYSRSSYDNGRSGSSRSRSRTPFSYPKPNGPLQQTSGERKVRFNNPLKQSSSGERKECILCNAAGRISLGHSIATCWHISKADKMQLAKALQVSVYEGEPSDDCDDCEEVSPSVDQVVVTPVSSTGSTEVQRVKSSTSPYFFAFKEHHTVKIIVDTGATSTLVSLAFVKRVGLVIQPTNHYARQLDKSRIQVAGEVKFTISFGDITLSVDGLVNSSIDCDILAGCPFY